MTPRRCRNSMFSRLGYNTIGTDCFIILCANILQRYGSIILLIIRSLNVRHNPHQRDQLAKPWTIFNNARECTFNDLLPQHWTYVALISTRKNVNITWLQWRQVVVSVMSIYKTYRTGPRVTPCSYHIAVNRTMYIHVHVHTASQETGPCVTSYT